MMRIESLNSDDVWVGMGSHSLMNVMDLTAAAHCLYDRDINEI